MTSQLFNVAQAFGVKAPKGLSIEGFADASHLAVLSFVDPRIPPMLEPLEGYLRRVSRSGPITGAWFREGVARWFRHGCIGLGSGMPGSSPGDARASRPIRPSMYWWTCRVR